METALDENYKELTSEIVAAYVGNNALRAADLPELIDIVYAGLKALRAPSVSPEPELPSPRVPIRKTITPDHLISLEDGRPYKSLKRHLARYGLTPAEYRTKWGLKPDYPMVAPNYSAYRSTMARTAGLGRKREPEPVAPPQRKAGARKLKPAATQA